jgi:hypothetical protein
VADKDISSPSSRPTGDIATSGVDWIGIRKGLRSSARREIAIVIEEEKFIKTTMSLRIDHRKALIVFVTGRDEEIRLINSKIEKRTDIPAYQSRQTIYSRGDDEEPAISSAAEHPPEKKDLRPRDSYTLQTRSRIPPRQGRRQRRGRSHRLARAAELHSGHRARNPHHRNEDLR